MSPSSWGGSTGRDVNRTAFTYAFRFGKTDVWKIGHAVDLAERIKHVNWHIPPEIVPHAWHPVLQQKWPDEIAANAMEQRVLRTLDRYRTEGEESAAQRVRSGRHGKPRSVFERLEISNGAYSVLFFKCSNERSGPAS